MSSSRKFLPPLHRLVTLSLVFEVLLCYHFCCWTFTLTLADSNRSELENKLRSIMESIPEMNQTMGQLFEKKFPNYGTIDERIKSDDNEDGNNLVQKCYDSQVDGSSAGKWNVNIFDSNLKLWKAIRQYYKAYPEKNISVNSVINLIYSIKEIYENCLELSENQDQNQIKFGFTPLSDLSDGQFQKMRGYRSPSESDLSSVGWHRSSGSDSKCVAPEDTQLPETYDWRQSDAVTPVRYQGMCSSCWAFAAIATVESALLIAKKATNSSQLDLSEQFLMDCTGSGCGTNGVLVPYKFLQQNGTTDESERLYEEKGQNCPSTKPKITAQIDDFCIRSKNRYTNGYKQENITDKIMQQSLVKYGPLFVILNSRLLSKNYKSGIFDSDDCSNKTDHAVTLVGYSPEAWIVKNSWGDGWGEDGYFRIARGKGLCGINTEISFPIL